MPAVKPLALGPNNAIRCMQPGDTIAYADLSGLPAYDRLSPLAAAEVAVAGAATLTATSFGRQHVCSGTSANYTVALPGVSGNAGKWAGVRMAAGLTRLVTLDAGAGVLIGSAQTLAMWSRESVLLYCDGANWSIVSGVCRPMTCGLYLASAGAVAINTWTRLLLATVDFDPSGLMADGSNNRINCPRGGWYLAAYKVPVVNSSGSGGVAALTAVTAFLQTSQATVGTPNPQSASVPGFVGAGGFGSAGETTTIAVAAGGYVHLGAYSYGCAVSVSPGVFGAALRLTEVPPW